ncbi:MAG TPA: hypothetical protein VIF62_27930 [Labilithrix sp.]|jgi:hypothetical protein
MSVIGSARRLLAGVALASVAAIALVAACKTPTQVTVDVTLVKSQCQQTNGTAIIAASDPASAEQRVDGGYPSAVTSSCADTPDQTKKEIGTLVLTPGDSDRGAVIVLVSFSKDHTAADCRPPLYTDCVVARRSFGFLDHQRLTLPIEIDYDCVNVPCDSTSTCRQGQCFSSQVDMTPGTDTFQPPGIEADGAVEDVVVPDAGGEGAPLNEAGMMVPYCNGSATPKLFCPDPATGNDVPCTLGNSQHCWAPSNGGPTCNTLPPTVPPLCCSGNDCESGICNRPGADPGTCGVVGVMPPYCDGANALHCFGAGMSDVVCKGTSSFCCASQSNFCATGQSLMCTDSTKHCCASGDCLSGVCVRPGAAPGTCMAVQGGMTFCDDAGALECAGALCASAICCPLVSTGMLGCAAKLSDCATAPDCCSDSDCRAGAGTLVCPGGPLFDTPAHSCASNGTDGGGDAGSSGAVCVAGQLQCAPDGPGACMPAGSCCGSSAASASCMGVGPCFPSPKKFCCQASDCPPKDGGPGLCPAAVGNGPASACN